MNVDQPLEAVYDEQTWSRIERGRRVRAAPNRLSTPSAAIVAGAILSGARDAVVDEPAEAEVQFVRLEPVGWIEGVRLLFVPDAPRSTVAFVRPQP
jgi:hypothetical protein